MSEGTKQRALLRPVPAILTIGPEAVAAETAVT